ncbi:hypothetical protein TNCV_2432411 [Trichonephila clavipes]|nr:hypothetical protein TNCV_2432411 [Trichonephila clavipes]
MKEKNARNSFKLVVTGFLGNKKDPNYKALVSELLQNYKILGCNMSVSPFPPTHIWTTFRKSWGLTSPICVLCDTGQDMTAAHLDECSALNDLNCSVKRYWRAHCLMT